MADEIRVNVILDPSQVQAGSSDIVSAIQAASADIQSAMNKTTTASNSTAAAIRSGFAGVETELKTVAAQVQATAAAVQQSGQAIVTTLNQMGAAGNNMSRGMGNAAHATAGVRREFIVLAHEAATGNWTRFGGSLMVLGERMDILGAVTSVAGLSIASLVGVAAAFAVAAAKGSLEISELNNKLALTGNIAGLTQERYLAMAKAISDANPMLTMGSARGSIMAVAGTGAFGSQSIQAVAAAVAEISRLSGQTQEKVAEDFAKMGEGVSKWANSNKEAKNLITAADMEYAKSLEEQGRQEEAEVYIAGKITDSLKHVETELGILPSLWNDVKDAASSAWDAMMDIGRPDTPAQKIAELQKRKEALKSGGLGANELDALGGGVTNNGGDNTRDLDNQIAFWQNEAKFREQNAKQQSDDASNNRTNKEGASKLDSMADRYDKMSAKAHELAEAQKAYNDALKGMPEPSMRTAQQTAYASKMKEEYDAAVAGINSRGPKEKTLGAGGAGAVGRAEDNGELALLKDRLSQEEKLLQTSYKNGEVTVQQYYAARMKIVQEGMEAEIAVAKRGVANAQTAAGFAGNNPNAQAEAQARIVQAKNRVALLTQQEQEQESNLTAEMQEQVDLQAKKLAQIQEESNVRRVDFNTSQTQRAAQLMVTEGKATNQQLIQLEQQLEDQRYAVAMAGLQERLALPHQSVEQQAQINAQIEALEEQHQSKMTELTNQGATEQAARQKQAMGDLQSDLESLSVALTTKPQQWRQAFMSFFSSLDQQLVKMSANGLFTAMLGPGSSGGNALSGVFGKIFGAGSMGSQNAAGGGLGALSKLLGGSGGSSSVQQIGAANITSATVPSMMVSEMTVLSSVGAGGGGGGGLASLLGGLGSSGSFAGAFGFSDAAVSGSTSAVIGGAMADSSTTGMSALMGINAYAQGTPYVPNTQLALLHEGEAVVPAAQNSPYAGSGTIGNVTNNFVLPGRIDTRTQSQIASMAGGAIQQATRRNG